MPRDIEISPIGFGNAPRGKDPMGQTGTISNNYQVPAPHAAYGRVLDALMDPRMAAFAPGMSLVRAPGLAGNAMRSAPAMTERGSWSPFGWGKDPRTVNAADKMAAMDGGYAPLKGQAHYSPTTQHLSEDPISWARLLERRTDVADNAIRDGLQEGLTPGQALDAVYSLNFAPKGYDKTLQLRYDAKNPRWYENELN